VISDGELRRLGLSAPAVSLAGPAVRAAATMALLAVIGGQAVVYWRIAASTVHVRRMADFGVFYESAERARTAARPYVPPVRDGRATRPPNLTPPHVVAALMPLSLLPPFVALGVWAAASVLSAGAALSIVFHESGLRWSARTALLTVAAVMGTAATGALIYSAQITWLLWAPLTLSWAYARRGRWIAAATILGVVASIKPFLLLFLPVFLAAGALRASLTLVGSACACYLVGLAALGVDAFADWVNGLRAVSWSGHIWNGSLLAYIQRAFLGTPRSSWPLEPVGIAPMLIGPIWFVSAMAIGIVTARALPRRPRLAIDVDRLFAITLAASFLLSPLAWIYYDFLLAAPFVALAASSQWRTRGRLLAFAFAGLALALTPGFLRAGQPSGLATLTIGSMYFWALAVLWLTAVRK
jgi:hypothetical protein